MQNVLRTCKKCGKTNHLSSGIDLCYYCGIKNCTSWRPESEPNHIYAPDEPLPEGFFIPDRRSDDPQ